MHPELPPGCDGFLSLQPSSSSIANQFYAKFLSSLPPARSDFITRPLSIPRRMAIALQDLADITHHPDVEDRDPLSCLSFSLVTPEVEKMQKDAFTRYHRGQRNAYSPLRPDGRPFREYVVVWVRRFQVECVLTTLLDTLHDTTTTGLRVMVSTDCRMQPAVSCYFSFYSSREYAN